MPLESDAIISPRHSINNIFFPLFRQLCTSLSFLFDTPFRERIECAHVMWETTGVWSSNLLGKRRTKVVCLCAIRRCRVHDINRTFGVSACLEVDSHEKESLHAH